MGGGEDSELFCPKECTGVVANKINNFTLLANITSHTTKCIDWIQAKLHIVEAKTGDW